MADVRVTQVRSSASRQADQGRTLRALGLTRIGSSVVHEDRPEILGMIAKVAHLVRVEPATGPAAGDRLRRSQRAGAA